MMKDEDRSDLDRFIEERTAANPEFRALLELAIAKRGDPLGDVYASGGCPPDQPHGETTRTESW